MKNKILLALLAVSIALNVFALTGCDESEAYEYSTDDRLVDVRNFNATGYWSTYSNPRGCVVVDRQTKVEYWYIYSGETGVSLTLLVDQDGKPLIYKGE